MGLLFLICFLVNVYRVAYHDYTFRSTAPKEEKEPDDPKYYAELGSDYSGATTHLLSYNLLGISL